MLVLLAGLSVGVGVLVERVAVALVALKFGGAAYLVWLGVQAYRHRGQLAAVLNEPTSAPKPAWAFVDKHGPARLEAACARAVEVGDPSYRTIKGILAAGTEARPVVRASGDGGAAAHLHGPDALFPDPPAAEVVPRPPDVVPASADVIPAASAASNVVPLSVTSKGRHRSPPTRGCARRCGR